MKHFRLSIATCRLLGRFIWVGVALFGVVFLATETLARVGGGQGYGGGGGSGGGGDGGGLGALIYLLFRFLLWLTIEHPAIGIPLDIIVIAAVIYYFSRRSKKPVPSSSSPVLGLDLGPGRASQLGITQAFNQLRRFDPNFSEIIFTDFCYALYGRAHEARGRGRGALDELSPYLSAGARASLLHLNAPNLKAVQGIIVGSMQVTNVTGLATPKVEISIEFEANYTEFTPREGDPRGEMSYYVRERWELERKRDVLSPPPEQATALHCPRCGAPLQKDTTGACAFCATRIESGEFQWYVRRSITLSREARGPLLTSNVPEVGTEYPSVVQPNFEAVRAGFEQNNPGFGWADFQGRARMIFNELQEAWSSLNWERARPHETDNIFQMHRYWIEAYKAQKLRNVLAHYEIRRMQPVKIKQDAFYQAITLRIFAQGYDYTEDQNGRVVAGSKSSLRQWSEYWTFVRNSKAKPAAARADLNCPNCGAPLKVSATGICEFCGGKITSGEFDWVLSKIEQDESYGG
ncbi:MAG TPA: transporter [Pyrinomonadaceae bacterium]|nr:transporter [Pyrinomonadaceae bacterium]